MPILIFVMAAVLGGTGVAPVIDGYPRRRRPDLTERLRPYQPSVSDEAQDWLDRH